MSNYFEPDFAWSTIYKVNSFEEFEKGYLIKGKFIDTVPEDVKVEYLKVENMLAQSYHYYPLYDEAFRTLLRIIELAVKQKCLQLGVEIKRKSKKGKEVAFTLQDLIVKIDHTEPLRNVAHNLDISRDIRNALFHEDQSSMSGVISKNSLISIVNTLNQMFSEYAIHEALSIERTNGKEIQKEVLNNCLRLEYKGEMYVSFGASLLDVVYIKDKPVHCWVVYRVRLDIKQLLSGGYRPNPVLIPIHEVSYKNGMIVGEDVEGNRVCIESTDHPDNLAVYRKYFEDLNSSQLDHSEIVIWDQLSRQKMAEEFTKFMYDNCWN